MISSATLRQRSPDRVGINIAELDPDGWDRYVESANGGTFFQSYDWGEARSRNGWASHRITDNAEQASAAAVVQVGLRRIGPWRVVYGQRGPVWSSLVGLECLLERIARFARDSGAAFVKLNPDIPPESHSSFEAYQSSGSTTINHFHEKLLLLAERMNTGAARRLAAGRHSYMRSFLERFRHEWEGES